MLERIERLEREKRQKKGLNYYREQSPVLLGEHSFVYKRAVDGLRLMDQRTLDPSQSLKFILGGFHNAWTVADFISLGNEIHPGVHQNICLDMNPEPLKSLDKKANITKLQGRLEQLPFQKNSIGLLVLDFTLNYMNDSQIKRFALSCEEVLSDHGLIMATLSEYPNRYPWDKFIDWYNHTNPLYFRNLKAVLHLLNPLKLIFLSQFQTTIRSHFRGRKPPDTYLLILAKSTSSLLERGPEPFFISRR